MNLRVSRHFAVLATAVVVAACSCVAAGARPSTTTPDVVHEVSVKLTNTAIDIPKDQYVQANGITRYLRGSVVDFTFKNRGSKPITVQLTTKAKTNAPVTAGKSGGVASAGKAIRPGFAQHWTLHFYYRGTFVMRAVIGGKVAVRRTIIIF
jgi:hypothetical protein